MRCITPLLALGITYLACSVHAQRIRPGQLTEQAIANENETMTQGADQYIGHEKTAEEKVKVEEETPSSEADGDATGSEDSAVDEEEPPVPISVTLFSGAPGPKECRGRPVLNVNLSKPGSRHSTPTCYNVAGTIAQCGNLVANKDDGCEARLFSEPDCLTFVNVAVFVPEQRALGGYMRSIEIRCGVTGAMPAPLNLPGLEIPAVDVQQGVRNVVSRPVHLSIYLCMAYERYIYLASNKTSNEY